MTKRLLLILMVLAAFMSLGPAAFGAMYWPSSSWTTATPASVGWDSTALNSLVSYVGARSTEGFIVVVDGKIISETYWSPFTSSSVKTWFSATKTMAGLMIGMAEENGDLDLSDDMYGYFSGLGFLSGEGDTIWHHLTMTSGLNSSCDDFDATPGTDWTYNTDAYRMLFHVIEDASGQQIEDYSADKLWSVMGCEYTGWKNALLGATSINPTGKANMEGSTRDFARHGLMILREGTWDGVRVINRDYLDDATTQSQALNESYGYLTWLGGYDSFVFTDDTYYNSTLFPDGPGDTIAALGANDKILFAIPSLNCVVARLGDNSGVNWNDPADSFFNQILDRLMAAAPADGTAPSTPSSLSASGYDGYVIVDWAHNTDSDIAGYELYRSTASDGTYTQLRADLIINLDEYRDDDVTNNTTYYYKVKAVDTSGNASSLTSYTSATPSSAGNQAPMFTSDPISKPNATENASYTGQTLATNAWDPDADSLTFTKVSGPAWLSVSSSGALSGTPGSGDVGSNSWTVRVADASENDTATLSITVDEEGCGAVTADSPVSGAKGAALPLIGAFLALAAWFVRRLVF